MLISLEVDDSESESDDKHGGLKDADGKNGAIDQDVV